ncbi:MAG: hypothetical protein A3H71_02530 [Candidatus Sungbacteria bacterium RIFCSPLOWO2_02_FULL_48_13b]|uniref:Pilus assembly protein PilO n=2 Tax=Candidatus Sungiibacteriota TaxID=1817917 RepID=A0A1G2LFL1_9BACT|nr:MAG: hypothetical protein A3C12_00505 [Candidatus Sungbacteria bacterium RIFCSPHIGHO2_02_FULL_49_20]OHA10433.1 MAG: hypothetical protein A3H71_02530 [Candidatus Sungbacteria bacterium RIFCSPLOWO2_02_FULL_48_13b]
MSRSTFSFILIVIGITVYYFFLTKEWAVLTEARANNIGASRALEELTSIQQKSESLRDIYNRIDATSLARINSMVPKGVNGAGLVTDIETLASRNNVILRQFDFGGATVRREAAGSAPAEFDVRAGAFPLTIKFDIFGRYEDFRKFLTDLELNQRLIDITGLNFGVGTDMDSRMMINVSAKAYYQ